MASRRAVLSLIATVSLLLGSCGYVQPHLQIPDLQITEPSFRATLVDYTGGAVLGGNKVDILLNGEEIFPAKLEAIRAARKSITYAQYVFEDGPPAADTARSEERRVGKECRL